MAQNVFDNRAASNMHSDNTKTQGKADASASAPRDGQVARSPAGKAKANKMTLYSSEEEGASPRVDETVLKPNQVEKEVKAYFREEHEGEIDLPAWWKRHSDEYPLLAQVARRNFGVRASSAEAERDFSAAGLVVSKQRTRLTSAHVKYLTFCALNKQYIPETPPSKIDSESPDNGR